MERQYDSLIRDKYISWGAKGLYTAYYHLLGEKDVVKKDEIDEFFEGTQVFSKYLIELIDAGYMTYNDQNKTLTLELKEGHNDL